MISWGWVGRSMSACCISTLNSLDFLGHLGMKEKRRRGKKLLHQGRNPGIISFAITGTWAFTHCFCAQPFLLLPFPHWCFHHAILLEATNLNGFTGKPLVFSLQVTTNYTSEGGIFCSPQASPFVIWNGSRFVLGRFGKGQKARIILKSFCNLPLLILVPEHWSAAACGEAPGTAWSLVANNCSPFPSTAIPAPQFLLSVVHGWSSLNKTIPFKFLLKTYFHCDYNLALIHHWGPGSSHWRSLMLI